MADFKNDGGQAFPVAPSRAPNGYTRDDGHPGMTLRDYFAAQIIAGMWACSETFGTHEEIAEGAYAGADAMLKVREES